MPAHKVRPNFCGACRFFTPPRLDGYWKVRSNDQKPGRCTRSSPEGHDAYRDETCASYTARNPEFDAHFSGG